MVQPMGEVVVLPPRSIIFYFVIVLEIIRGNVRQLENTAELQRFSTASVCYFKVNSASINRGDIVKSPQETRTCHLLLMSIN